MKQSTSFAQVATNLLNVLQGYTKGIQFIAVLTLLLTVSIVQAWGAVTGDTFTRISTAAELNDGDEIIFVNQTETYSCATTQNGNNRSQTSITTNNHTYTYDSKSAVQIFVVKKNGNNYGFHTGNGYIYSASSSNDYLRTNTTAASTAPSGNYAWTLSVSNYVFTVKNVTNTSYYMAFNGTTIFSQYKTGQSKPYIYKKNAAPTCTPLKMSIVTATPGDSKITLTWSAVNNASNYTVTCLGGTVGSVTGASTKTCTITGLTNGTSYNWSVMPVGDGTTYCKENTPATGSTTPNATYSITYHDKDGAHSVDALGGSALLEVLPNNPTSCDIDLYPHFVGWSTTDIPSGGTTEQPTLVSAEIVNSTTASKTYYAVWSDVDPNVGGGSWEKATSISVGDKVVFVHEEKKRELTGVANDIGTATERTNGIPNGIEGTYVLTVEAGTANNSYSFKNENIYLSWSSGNNLYTSDTKNNASSWTINTSTDGNFKFANVGTTSRILQFNSSSPRWACYTSSPSAFQIYKQSAATGTATYITTCSAQPSYSVTYEADGGETTCEDNTKYEEGADVMLCGEIPTKENYVFNGWSSTPSVTVTDGKFKMPKSDVIFTAQWSECTGPRITAFNRNGTTDGTYNLGANLGTLSVTAEPSNGGNLRYCWYQYDDATTKDQAKLAAGTNSEATYQIPNNEPCIARHYYCIVSEEGCNKTQESAISGALTLNAIQHTITWSVNGTTQSLSPSSVTDGNNLGTLPTPNLDGICEGKTFVGWTTEANKNYSHETTAPSLITEDTKPNGDVTYYAVFATPEDGAQKTIIFANEWNDTQDLSEHSYFDNAITLSFAKNEGTTAPKYYASSAAIRLYYGNTMTVTTTAPMQSITFTFVTEDANGNSISTYPDYGTLSKTPTNQSSEFLTHTWNVNTTEVTFTIGTNSNGDASGHCKISQIDVVTGDGDAVTYSNYTTSCTTTYTVTYNGNGNTGGTVPTDNNKYEENAQVTVLGNTSNLVKEGYTFAGWNTQSDGNGTDYGADATFEITKNTTLYAKWEANTYTVCFDANGGTGTMENQSFTYGAEQALSSNKFTRDSYIFAGWATTADGDVVYTDAQSVSNLTTTNGATVTLYAQWSELYTVTFYNMGSVYTTKTQESVGGSITFPEAPSACEGYTFDGWSATEVDGVPSYKAVTTITPNEDTQLYAVYSKSEDGGGTETVDDKLVHTINGKTEINTSYVEFSGKSYNSGAIYAGQSSNGNNSNIKGVIQIRSTNSNSGIVTTTSGGKAKKVTVVWNSNTASGRTLNVYGKNSAYSAASDLYNNSNQGDLLGTIVYDTSTELTISGDYEYIGLRSSENAMYFTSITITWATGGPSTTYTTSPDCAEVYNITIDSNIEHGSVTASPMSAVAGTTISLTATPDDTYKFDSWQVTDENSNTIDVTTENTFIMPETDVTVSAIFTEKKRYTITWYANGSEYTTTDVIEDIQIAPPALPNMENYCGVFAGWTTESPVSGNFDEAPTLYNEQSEFPLATEETPKTFYAVFADVEGIIPELPKTIAYWEKQQITTESDMSATIGTGIMTSNVNLSTESNRTYQSTINTEATITLSGLNLTSYDDITLTFWARGSAKGDITITTDLSNEVISTVTLTGTEVLYKINNIPSTATSITLTYSANPGSFFFGTVKLLETPAVYSFEKLTAENTNGWTGSDWDGYYLITNGQSTLLALDGNAILDRSYEKVEEQNDVIEVPITMAFCVTYDATKSGYSLQGVGDGMFLISKGNDGKEIGAAEKENAAYFPTIGYNQLTTSSNMELSWNTSGDFLRFYNPPKEAPQMYKIMSELSNYRTLCTYDIVLKNNYVDDDSKDGLATITATKTTFNTFTPPTQRPGYIIEGYYAEPQCTKKVVEANQTLITNVDEYTQNGQWIGGNVELYTKWQPLIYNLQSGNFSDWGTCSGGNLTLDGSAIGVKYQLYKDDVKYGEEISGTGMALTWEITESGSYTVKSVDPEMLMNGKAVVQLQDPTIVGENTVEVGKTITLTHPGHRDAAGSWVSSNPEIARVDNNTVTGVAAGIVTITFHGLGNCDATHEVTVVNPEYTMTWKIDEGDYATTTVQAGKTIAALPTNPFDNALGCCADKFIGWTASAAQTISKADVFTTLAEAQTKFPNITEDKTFYAVFATAAQGVGTSIADFSEMGYENNTAVTTPIILGDGEGHGDATITLAKAQSSKNDAKYYDDGEAVRIYAGGTITIASTYNNATIKNIVFTFAGNDVVGENTITASSGTYDNGTWTGDASTVTFTIAGSTGHRRIASITVTTGVAGSQYTNYVTSCDKMNDPSLGAVQLTYNSGDAIAVNCGNLSSKHSAASITFPNAVNLTCPITVTAPAGFVLATNKQSDTYTQTVLIKPVKTAGENKGKITKTVYVRADAPENSETDYSSNITITGEEITETTVTVKADVTCKTYTFKTLTHIGDEHTSNTYYAGQIIEVAPVEPVKDACSENYTFDGWSISEVEYGSLIYNKVSFPYTMPAEDVTLYPVYQCNKTADYHRVTSDLGANNWAGDYLIAASSQIFANGSTGGTDDVNCIGGAGSAVNPEDNLIDDLVKYAWGDVFNVTLVKVDGGYVLQTGDKKYNYLTNGATSAGLSVNEDIKYASINNNPLTVTFNNEKDIVITNPVNTNGFALKYSSQNSSFRFLKSGTSIYLYKKSTLYTTSLICGTIETEATPMVTSTAGQTVKVNVPITLTASLGNKTTITGTSDNAAFTVTALNDITAGDHTIAVNYTPTKTTDGIETANITLKASAGNNASTTFQVTGRHLPENFVIAAKAGGEWVALTAKVSNGTQVAVPIIVDDKTAPTKAIVALNTCQYKLLGLTTKNRFDVNGTAVHLYSTQTEKVLNASTASGTSTYLNTDATHDNAEISDNALFYEWQLVTEDLKKYTITNSNTTNTSNTRLGYSAATGQWGMYVNNVNVNQELYLLPIESHFTELNVEVMEWGTNSMALRIDGTAPSKLDVTLGENTNTVTLANLNSGNISDIYKAEGIDLTTNDCEIMKIVDNANPNSGTLIRKPILVNTTEAVSSTYRTKLTDDYCAHCDIVILKDAKLTADQGIHDHTSFAKIYVYPGGKLVLDAKSLGVKQQVYLRGGYSWLNSKYALPELYLNGTIDFNGSGNIIYDYYIQNYKYYQFALPYDVQLAKVTDEAGIDNFPVWVKHYNGALRAADPHATSWEWYPNEDGDANAYFKAGEGYIIAAQPRQVGNTANRPLSIIRFPLGNKVFNKTNGLESDLSIPTKAHGIDGYKAGTVTANNVGWNFVGNPFLSTWQGNIGYKQLTKHPNEANWDGTYDWVDADIKYITIMSAESGSDYAQYIASETELKPFFPFYLQETANGGSGTIDFAAANRMKKAPAAWNVGQEEREAYVQLEIATDAVADQTGVFVGNKYSDDLDFDDYEKMFGTSSELPKLWIMHDDKRMAFEAMTESTAATYIPLGYRAPKIGKYIFAINEEASKVSEVEAVYLTDNQTGVTDFDLLSSAYEFESNGELYNDSRFTIRIVLRDESSSTVTGVENVLHFNSDHPYKFIYQDKMYILRNGVIYDAMGKQVQTINK